MTAPRFLVERADGEVRIAFYEDGRLYEFERHGANAFPLTGRVYLGRVQRAVRGMNAAFVDIGLEKNGFLPITDGTLPADGDRVLVQVKKPPLGDKGAFLTRDIALPGALLMLLPLGRGVGVSRRVSGKARDALHALGIPLKPEGMGLVMRAAATEQTDGLADELNLLLEKWQTIAKCARTARAPSLIDEGENPVDALARDIRRVADIRFETNDSALLERIGGQFASARLAEAPVTVSGAAEDYEKALRRKQRLPGGGGLVIDPCEAMTVIDVNSGADTGGHGGIEQTALRVNLEAADEIARLMRLRGIGGVIVVDFIDMDDPAHMDQVLARMRANLSRDRVKAEALGFTRLKHMEITRKRVLGREEGDADE